MELYQKAEKAIKDYDMIKKGESVVVALSGGADSVSLLFVLKKLSEEFCFSLSACHVNHGLRGKESDEDMEFCKRLCDAEKTELQILDTDIRSFQQKHESLEETARRVRYSFFAEVSKGKKLATAHNANDCAETVLLNMMRGTGLKGLCGIPPVRENIIRPLIYCTRSEIEGFCEKNDIAFVTDKTNLSDDYTRNKVRHFILPEMMKINPSLLDTFSRMEKSLRQDSEYLETLANELLKKAKGNNGYRVEVLQKETEPILNRAIKKILTDGSIEPSTLRIDMTRKIILDGRGKINPCKGKFVTIKKHEIFIEEREQIYRKHIKSI